MRSVTHFTGRGLDPGQSLRARPADLGGPAELLEEPDRPGRDVELARAARRAGRRSGRRGAGCARTRRSDRNASGQKFADLSRAAKGRSPIMWQMELTDQVTWCSSAMRTRPAQKKQVSAPLHDMVIRPPITAGPKIETSVQTQKYLLCRAMSLSASRSGAKRCWLVESRSKIQPMWACQKPLASAATEVPYSHGECGSPSRSENAWCRRWSATQMMTGPWAAIWPAPARAILQRPVGLERAVGEQPVEPDGDAHAGDDVEREGDDDVGPAQSPTPGERDRPAIDGEQRHQREPVDGDLRGDPAFAVQNRLGPGRRGRDIAGLGGRLACWSGRLPWRWRTGVGSQANNLFGQVAIVGARRGSESNGTGWNVKSE